MFGARILAAKGAKHDGILEGGASVSRTETTIVIGRPIEDVWDFLTDLHNLATWCPDADHITQLSEGPFGKGSMLMVSGRIGPLRVSSRRQVKILEPHRAIELRSVGGPLGGSVLTRVDLQRAGAGTRFTGTSEAYGLPAVLTLFGLGRRKDRDEFFATLKRSLEAQIEPAAAPAAEPRTMQAPPVRQAAAPPERQTAAPPERQAAAPLADSGSVPFPTVLDGSAAAASARAIQVPPSPKDADAVEVHRAPSADDDRLLLRLVSERGPAPTFEVTRSGATLGRGPDNTIRLDDLSVSRQHARITYRQGGYWLSDLKSTSGTWIDGAKLNASSRLAAGQIIGIGILRLRAAFAAAGDDMATNGEAAQPPEEMARQGQ